MNIAQAKEQIKDSVEAYLAQDETGSYSIPQASQRPLYLLGAPGIGKTAIVEQVARELGIGLVAYSMTHHTRQSALGLPYIEQEEYGEKSFKVSKYTMSEIIASIYDYMKTTGVDEGILFIDEINCVSETLYPSMLQFLQFKTFGRHKVPESWIVVCAGNPPEYNKSVHEFDIVTLDRLRKIEIEPDFEAWKPYAYANSVHPAVISYLDIKPSHFYSVESRPGEKSFVTARGWDDLSRLIKLFEKQGKKVDLSLCGQYLQNEEISEHFAQYYALFNKYKSDYQVSKILEGNAPEEIGSRASKARFDERLALLRLILDAHDERMGEVLDEEACATKERDALRSIKPKVLAKGADEITLAEAADALETEARRDIKTERASLKQARPALLAASRIRELAALYGTRADLSAEQAWAEVEKAYAKDIEKLKGDVECASAELDNSFAFVERHFDDGREMAAFVAEITARANISQFISRFGSESFYVHNESALADSYTEALQDKLASIDLDAAEAEQAAERSCSNCSC